MLLHGEPGTGKTMTAESFAEMIEKPLYRIAFANIGRELGEAEKYLVSVFNIATIWNCVVLIDEANIFLESRSSSSDLERNAMVSMFLRCIEHYDGMLILTSSGRAAIDEAFKSRLHVTLAYATPGKTERCIMWKDFIQSLSDNGVDLDYGEISETWDQLASQELNGREISNLCSTAQMLARHRGQTLRYSHLEEAMAAMKDFKKYLKETPGDGDMGDKISI
jgi:SpoVK/Ycf46/Vps4 family AAA+-type ATPase